MKFKYLKLLLLSSTLTLISLVSLNSVIADASSFKKAINKINHSVNLVEKNNNMLVLEELWYQNTPMYKEFTKGKVYEENFQLQKYFKVSYEASIINRIKTDSNYVIEEVSKDHVIQAMKQNNNKDIDIKNNGYIQLILDVNRWAETNYDVSSSYYVLTPPLIAGSTISSPHYIGPDNLTSSYSPEFSFDPKSAIAFTQAEDIYTNESISSTPNMLTNVSIIGMELPSEKQLLYKNHRGLISYTLIRSFGSYGKIYTDYLDNTKSFNRSISISINF